MSGNADLFAVMKVTQACANGQARYEFALTAHGRILKRDGQLTAVDPQEITRSARDSLAGVLSRAFA